MDRFQDAKERVVANLLDPVLDLMKEANAAVEAAERRAVQAETVLEALRPVWAQGWTEDSQAAQASANALSELWLLLQAKNQTEAVQNLLRLLKVDSSSAQKISDKWAERAAGTWHPGDESD